MKFLYRFLVWGDNVALLSMYSKLRLEFPVFFEMKRVDSVGYVVSKCNICDYDFIYFEINEYNYTYFTDEIRKYKEELSIWLKFFTITSSVEDLKKENVSKLIRNIFGHSTVEIAYIDKYEHFSFEFMEFLLFLPKKRIFLSDKRILEVDFPSKSIFVVNTEKKCKLSDAESELLRHLFMSWEENRKYVKEIKFKGISKENSLPVLLSRLRKKLRYLSEVEKLFLSISKDRKYGYFLEEKTK
ncbi:MAG: hypothetical protein ABGX27_01335 [Desulfurobacteriaceae bacterium]